MKKLSLFLFVAVTLGACKKDNENTPTPPSRTELLTAKNWRISGHTSTTVSNGTTIKKDEYAASPACERDDFTKFNASKVVVYDQGASKCDASDPQTENGAWDINKDETKLTVASPALASLALPCDIVELTATTLHIRFVIPIPGGTATDSETDDVTFTAF